LHDIIFGTSDNNEAEEEKEEGKQPRRKRHFWE